MPELRSLVDFSAPLWIGRMTMIGVQQGTILVLSIFLSTSEVGQYKAAEQIVFFIVSIDVILGQTIFPALCKLRESPRQIGAGFTKASRASMLWIPGIGVGMACFAEAIVRYVLTTKWAGAELFVRAQGIALIVGGVGYSWALLFETRGKTRPILNVIAVLGAAFLLLFFPLTWMFGKTGAAVGVIATCAAGFAAKQHYINRLEMGVSLFEIVRRSLVAAIAAAAAVYAIRLGLHPGAGPQSVIVQLLVYGMVYGGVLVWSERALLTEVIQVVWRRTQGVQLASAGD
jgi:O-antigen/teichoic acid export membrane protein